MVANSSANVGKVAPFFTFPPERLFVRPTANFGNPSNFASFNDYYGQSTPTPYLFFSAYNRANGYAPAYAIPILGVQPYYQSGTTVKQYLNPNSIQIICAGPDGNFGGGGGPWTPANAELFYPAGTAGADDQANFYGANLGVSQ
jgi:hypothetical protein